MYRTATVVEIVAAAAELQAKVADAGITVTPNGYGHRAECDRCHWSACHGTVSAMLDHAAGCAA